MEQFNLEKWIKDKSRKVVTRDGREVELYYSPTSRIPLIGATTSDNEIHQYTKDGFQCDTFNQAKNDIFFADEEEELTEFEKELRYWIGQSLCNYENNGCISDNMSDSVNIYLKAASKQLLDLARKEIEKDLPKWKKAKEDRVLNWVVKFNQDGNIIFSDVVYKGEYFIILQSLESLPKEE